VPENVPARPEHSIGRPEPNVGQAELLPVSAFHLVFTLPALIADIAYQNKRMIYDLLFKAAAKTTITIAADEHIHPPQQVVLGMRSSRRNS